MTLFTLVRLLLEGIWAETREEGAHLSSHIDAGRGDRIIASHGLDVYDGLGQSIH